MGVDTNTHIGPYIKVKGTKKETIERNIITCLNKECERHKNNLSAEKNFCSDCGSKIGSLKYKEKISLDPYDLIYDEPYEDEFYDELCHAFDEKKTHYFIPNEETPFDKKRGTIDENDNGLVDLTDYNSKEEIEWFKKRYKKIIDVFHKEFGENCLEVRWGIIQWYS